MSAPQRTFYTVLGWATWRGARFYVRRRFLSARDATQWRRRLAFGLGGVAVGALVWRRRHAAPPHVSFPVPAPRPASASVAADGEPSDTDGSDEAA